jgi:hypothetical protein
MGRLLRITSWLSCGLTMPTSCRRRWAAQRVKRLAPMSRPSPRFRPLAEPLRPLPMGVRAWLIAAPLLALGALALAATTPGAGSTCASKGISTPAAREGNCLRKANLFGRGVTYNVVDAGHVLRMPRLDAELLATRTQTVIITDPQRSPSFYPDGTGTLVCFEVAITNHGPAPLSYDAGGADVDLLLQGTRSRRDSYELADMPGVGHEPMPALADQPPIQPGQTTIGWVAFDAPEWAPETLTYRASDLEFRLPTNGNASEPGNTYVGQIRLWKAANAAGALALTDDPTA